MRIQGFSLLWLKRETTNFYEYLFNIDLYVLTISIIMIICYNFCIYVTCKLVTLLGKAHQNNRQCFPGKHKSFPTHFSRRYGTNSIMLLDFWLPYPESYHSQLIEKDGERSKSILINDIITKHRASCSQIWHWRLLKSGLKTQQRGSVSWEYLRIHRNLVYFQNIHMET